MNLNSGQDLNIENPLFKISSNSLRKIYSHLSIRSLWALSATCRRFFCSVNFYVTDVHLLIQDEYAPYDLDNIGKNSLVLFNVNPGNFIILYRF